MDDLLSEKEQIEQMRAWWSEYGNYVIAGIVLGAAILIGVNRYQASVEQAQLEASTLYDTLTNHVVDGRLEAAETVSGQIVGKHPDSPYASQALLALARLYMDQNRDQDAADTLRELLASDADDAFKHVARIRLAKVLLYQDRAEEVLSLLSERHNDAFAARYAEALGDAYVKLGRYDEAREAYQRALSEPNQAATIDQSFVQLKLLDLPLATFAGADSADQGTGDNGDGQPDAVEDATPSSAEPGNGTGSTATPDDDGTATDPDEATTPAEEITE